MSLSMRVVLPFSALFPEEQPKELELYLEGIGRETLLKISPFFLGFNQDKSEYSNPFRFLEMFFSKGNEVVFHSISKNIKIFLEENDFSIDQVEIPYVLSSLTLFEFVYTNIPYRENTITNHEIEINIFKAYVLLNETLTEIGGKIAEESTKDIDVEFKASAYFLALQFHNFELTNYRIDNLFSTQFIRAIMLFEFLESREDCKFLLEEFYIYFKVDSYKDYLKRILPISIGIIMRDKESHTDIVISDDDATGILDKLSIDDEEFKAEYDFINLRSRPLFKISETVYRIISPQFALELIYTGLYFKLKYIYDTLPKEKRPKKDLYHLKTYEFSEKFVLNNLLKNFYFGNRYIQKSGDDLNGIDGAPDYYVRNGNKIFLFESKDILPSVNVKKSFDFSLIKEELEKKLYFNEKGSPKAVLQLINTIRKILNEDIKFDNNFKSRKIKIYPVLVLHYRLFNVGGLNKLINFWFKEELGKLEKEGLEISNVKPLVIIDIDTLIFYQDLFKDKKLNLENCLEEFYETYFDFKLKLKKIKNKAEVAEALRNSLLPFATYLDKKVDKLSIRQLPKQLLEKGYGLFDEVTGT